MIDSLLYYHAVLSFYPLYLKNGPSIIDTFPRGPLQSCTNSQVSIRETTVQVLGRDTTKSLQDPYFPVITPQSHSSRSHLQELVI